MYKYMCIYTYICVYIYIYIYIYMYIRNNTALLTRLQQMSAHSASPKLRGSTYDNIASACTGFPSGSSVKV